MNTSFYRAAIKANPILSVEEEKELLHTVRHAGNMTVVKAAKDRLILSNMRFVISMANRASYQNRGLTSEELVDEGLAGLLKAVEKFDLSSNVRFLSYAKSWVNKAILEAIYNTGNAIRLPQNHKDEVKNFCVESLDASIQGNSKDMDECCLGDFICDPGNNAEVEAERKDLKSVIDTAMSKVLWNEEYIIREHNGMNDEKECMSFTELGERFDCTRQRIQQIYAKAMKRLRQNDIRQLFDGYVPCV